MQHTRIQSAPAINKTSFYNICPKKSVCCMKECTAYTGFFISRICIFRPDGCIMSGFLPPVLPIFIGIMFNIAL